MFLNACFLKKNRSIAMITKSNHEVLVDSVNVENVRNIQDENVYQVIEYKNYIIKHLYSYINNRDYICIYNNKKLLNKLPLPVPDTEVKNFNCSPLTIENEFLKLNLTYGGGQYYYEYSFYFEVLENHIVLKKIEESILIENSENIKEVKTSFVNNEISSEYFLDFFKVK